MISIRKIRHPHQGHQVNASDVEKEGISEQNATVRLEILPTPLIVNLTRI